MLIGKYFRVCVWAAVCVGAQGDACYPPPIYSEIFAEIFAEIFVGVPGFGVGGCGRDPIE